MKASFVVFELPPFFENIRKRVVKSPTPDFLKGIDRFGEMAGDRCTPGFVLYNGDEQYTLRGTRVINPLKYGGMEGLW